MHNSIGTYIVLVWLTCLCDCDLLKNKLYNIIYIYIYNTCLLLIYNIILSDLPWKEVCLDLSCLFCLTTCDHVCKSAGYFINCTMYTVKHTPAIT